jgi:hypothetical protein
MCGFVPIGASDRLDEVLLGFEPKSDNLFAVMLNVRHLAWKPERRLIVGNYPPPCGRAK